ncbi:unnamed protein product [Prunus armeniaca]
MTVMGIVDLGGAKRKLYGDDASDTVKETSLEGFPRLRGQFWLDLFDTYSTLSGSVQRTMMLSLDHKRPSLIVPCVVMGWASRALWLVFGWICFISTVCFDPVQRTVMLSLDHRRPSLTVSAECWALFSEFVGGLYVLSISHKLFDLSV